MHTIETDTNGLHGEQQFPAFAERRSWDILPRIASITDRGYCEYSVALGLDFSQFVGQRILDLGAGKKARFVREASASGIEAYGVNPNWANADYAGSRLQIGKRAVAAMAQSLPFKDNSFDFIVSFWGVPTYLPGTKAAYQNTFSEIRRVLAPDSWALLAPIPRATATEPALTDILDAEFPNEYELLGTDFIPKLLLTKDLSVEKRTALDEQRPVMAVSRFPIW